MRVMTLTLLIESKLDTDVSSSHNETIICPENYRTLAEYNSRENGCAISHGHKNSNETMSTQRFRDTQRTVCGLHCRLLKIMESGLVGSDSLAVGCVSLRLTSCQKISYAILVASYHGSIQVSLHSCLAEAYGDLEFL